jgi:hypothetical protein
MWIVVGREVIPLYKPIPIAAMFHEIKATKVHEEAGLVGRLVKLLRDERQQHPNNHNNKEAVSYLYTRFNRNTLFWLGVCTGKNCH